MRRTVWCLALALLAAHARGGELTCDRPTVQLGDLKAGAPLGHRFNVTNPGPGPVELLGFAASCGCFKPGLAKRTLQAGESTVIDLVGNTLAQPAGPQSWRLRLHYRDGTGERELAFEIRATLTVEVAVVPPTLTLNTEGTLAHEITLRDVRATPLAVTAVQTTATGLRAKLGEPRRLAEGGWVRPITVEVGADYPAGRAEEWLVLHSRDPDYPELRVPVTVVKRPRGTVTVRPAEVALTATPGEPLPARLVLLGDASTPVEVERVEPGHAAVTCTWASAPGAPTTLKVRVDAAKVPPDGLDSTVRVHRKGGAPVVVPVRVEWVRP